MSGNHGDCVNHYIPDVAKGVADSADYKKMLKEIDDIESATRNKKRKANAEIEAVDTCHSTAMKAMEIFKQDVLNQLDEMEHALTGKANEARENAKIMLNGVIDVCNIVKTSVEGMKKDISGVSVSQIFVQMKLNEKRLIECRNMLKNLETVSEMQTFKFEPTADVKDKLERNAAFGKLVFTKQTLASTQDIKHVVSRPCDKLSVKSSKDDKECDIVCIDMLSPEELVLADFANRSVKIVNITKCKVTYEKKLTSEPHGLTILNKDTFAVLYGFSLVVVRISMNLVSEKTRKLFDQNYGIKNKQNDLLILSNHPFPKLSLFNKNGRILQTILSDSEMRIFQYPAHVAVSTDERYIYVSDYYGKNKITRLSVTGDVINVYKNESREDNIQQARGIAVAEDGSVFVCDFFGDSIRMFTADLSNQMTILTEADGIHRPQSIYFSGRENKIFIGNNACNDILIFGLTW